MDRSMYTFIAILLLHTLATAQQIIKPQALRPDQTVGFISPASHITSTPASFESHVRQSMSLLRLRAFFSAHSFSRWGYFSGTDEERAADVMDAFTNNSIAGIISNRGGWGCNRILDLLDYNTIAKNPKIIMGYSDLTGLLNAIHLKTGLITFHGPMGLDNWNNANKNYAQQVLMEKKKPVYKVLDGVPIVTFRGGKARGRLLGGNLSVFTAMIGSQYIPSPSTLKDTILFLEEVDEAPYRVDRMLQQLRLSGYLDHVSGVVFGRCTSCEPNTGFSFLQVLHQHFDNLKVPAFYGAMFGHISQQYILPIGGVVEIDADAGTIEIIEDVVL